MNSDEFLRIFKEAFLRLNSIKHWNYVEVNYPKYLKHNKLVDNYTSQKMYTQYLESKDATDMATPTGPQIKYEGLSADWFFLDEISFGHLDRHSPNKKGNNMKTETVEMTRISYLTQRLEDIEYKKLNELEKTFNLYDDPTPLNGKELVDRILAGKYILPEKAPERFYGYAQDQLTWRDPSKKRDTDGYRKAHDDLMNARIAAEDVVVIGTPADGLAAVQAFEKWTPTVNTTVQ